MSREATLPGKIRQDAVLYILLAPALIYFLVFHILPMAGMSIAFQDFRLFGKSRFVGLKHFVILFSSPGFFTVLTNTLILSTMKIILFFPLPLVFALMVNELRAMALRRFVQSVAYLPHFLSWVVIAGVWIAFLSPTTGGANQILALAGQKPVDFMTSKDHIRWVLFFSET
ncbi:MAG: hypothetical protein ACOYM2_15740 [Rectinemataceae bacterium]